MVMIAVVSDNHDSDDNCDDDLVSDDCWVPLLIGFAGENEDNYNSDDNSDDNGK